MEQSLAEKSYDYIRQKLAVGELPPGSGERGLPAIDATTWKPQWEVGLTFEAVNQEAAV